MAEQTLTVKIVGDEKDLLRAFRSSTKATQRFSASFGTFLKGALVFEGVRRGIDVLSASLRAGIDEWRENAEVAAQTQAVIAATGGVANVTARGVEQIAKAIQGYSGISDEAVRRGANLILTFKNVRNEAGKGNAIFDRATKAAVDLSVAGFGSIETTAKQLGKALNDPIRGMTALSRAGVTFTTKQRDQIKALVESNRTLDAQRLILREVESQVGGSARALGDTLPGQLNKLREAARDAFGSLVGALADPLSQAAGQFAAFIPRIEEGVTRLTAAIGPGLARLVEAFTSRLPQIQRIAGSLLEPLRQHVVPVLSDVGRIVATFWANIVSVFDSRSGQLRQILANLGAVLSDVWTVARPTIVFLFTRALPAAIDVAIPALEKITRIVRVLARVFVRAVSTIVKAIELFLGGISRLADAASHLPGIGDSFAGIADKVNASRESLQSFVKELDALDGRTVEVEVVSRFRAIGDAGRRTSAEDAEEAAEDDARSVQQASDAQRKGAKQVATSADVARKETDKATSAAERQRKAFERLLAVLGLRRDRAAATAGLEDDIAVVRATKRALEEQLKVQKGNVDLQRQLLQANQDLAALRAQQRKGRQFEALGLTAEGEKRAPSVAALQRRLGTLRDQLKGTALDTTKTRSQLQRIARVLSGQFGAVGREVRLAIQRMFQDIAGGLRDGSEDLKGPLTATSGLNTRKVLAGLGLDPDVIRELRGRLSGFNTRGLALATAAAPAPTAGFGGVLGGILVESHVTVELDGERVGRAVTRSQQKTRRRNPPQKRGPNRGR